MRPNPFVLLILDGWGHRSDPEDNAIAHSSTPTWDNLWTNSPHTLLNASGLAVGLPPGQMGNSEVGHMNLGAGRIIYQQLTRISHAINSGEFKANIALLKAIDHAVMHKRAIHIMGLISPGGIHSHEDHIRATIDLAITRGATKIYCHAFLDGRDVLPQSAEASLMALQTHLNRIGGNICTVVGRYFAMDRDNNHDRTEKAYRLITEGQAEFQAPDALSALKMAYSRGETDEFVAPTRIGDTIITPQAGDSILFLNFRADRARQLSHALVNGLPELGAFLTLTEYDKKLRSLVAFPADTYINTLGEYLSKLNLRQLRLAETEKYAHVTFFFNCGIEKPYASEDRILIPSPHVATYDLQPEMSAELLTNTIVNALLKKEHDVIICNYANPDMVGHTGNFEAAKKAVLTIDNALACIIHALKNVDGQMLITADHGNIECMHDIASGQPHTAHTLSPVPLIYVGKQSIQLKDGGSLANVAPTLLQLLGLPKPKEMTADSLIL